MEVILKLFVTKHGKYIMSQIKYLLGMDCETSGMTFSSQVDEMLPDPSAAPSKNGYYQSVSWGLIVCDITTMQIVDKLYVEIKWDGESLWDKKAEKVHGLTKEYLEVNGKTDEDAACDIYDFITKWWPDPKAPISTMGHNIASFDHWYFRRLMSKFSLMPTLGNRVIDTNTIGIVCYNAYTSNELYELVGVKRTQHNALEDIKASWKVIKTTRSLFESYLTTDDTTEE